MMDTGISIHLRFGPMFDKLQGAENCWSMNGKNILP
jgi:hypothetical protein